MANVFYKDGLSALSRELHELPVKIERNILRGGLRAGARVIMEEAIRRVPVRSGALRRSIRLSTRFDRKAGRVSVNVKAGGGKAFYAHMVEFGTARHAIRPSNHNARKGALRIGNLWIPYIDHPGARERPFMRPALDHASQEAVDAMADYIRVRLMKLGKPLTR